MVSTRGAADSAIFCWAALRSAAFCSRFSLRSRFDSDRRFCSALMSAKTLIASSRVLISDMMSPNVAPWGRGLVVTEQVGPPIAGRLSIILGKDRVHRVLYL